MRRVHYHCSDYIPCRSGADGGQRQPLCEGVAAGRKARPREGRPHRPSRSRGSRSARGRRGGSLGAEPSRQAGLGWAGAAMAGSADLGECSPGWRLRRRLRSAQEAQQRQTGLVRQLQDEVRSGRCPAAGRLCRAALAAQEDSAGTRGASPGGRRQARGSEAPAAPVPPRSRCRAPPEHDSCSIAAIRPR